MDFVTVNANGQVTLPARERRKFGIGPGTALSVLELDDGLLLRKATPVSEGALAKIRRIADARGLSEKEIVRLCREIRSEVFREEYRG